MANRFWVGDSGGWLQMAHWSGTSGGSGGVSVPTQNDDVFFDANSFSMADQVVSIVSSPDMKSLNMTGVTNTPQFFDNGFTSLSFNIYGGMILSPNILWNFRGGFNFSPLSSGTYDIDFADIGLPDVSAVSSFPSIILFASPDYSAINFNIIGGFVAGDHALILQINSGSVDFNDVTISGISSIEINNGGAPGVSNSTIDFGTSSITIDGENVQDVTDNDVISVATTSSTKNIILTASDNLIQIFTQDNAKNYSIRYLNDTGVTITGSIGNLKIMESSLGHLIFESLSTEIGATPIITVENFDILAHPYHVDFYLHGGPDPE